ncbi:aldehyde dehydrogenase family protein [Nocardia sp. NPDC058058]|uniref:aldehyde dehydrogenase family protein n=1 Tax=Nocardia sp. NPDC058058 TaxID=3346317 RepID=UPI0036DF80B3
MDGYRISPLIDGNYRPAHTGEPIHTVRGESIGRLDFASDLLAGLTMNRLRAARPQPLATRLRVITDAARRIAEDTVDGLTPIAYARAQSATSGTPLAVVTGFLEQVRPAAQQVAEIVSEELTPQHYGPDRRVTVSVHRRGELVTVLSPANHPGVHVVLFELVALGYKIIVRPSRRDPFTPARIVRALIDAGLAEDTIALLPSTHEDAHRLVQGSDRAVVYGGPDIARRYENRPDVLVQGPGNSKVLELPGADHNQLTDLLITSIADGGGGQCLNASAALVADPAAQMHTVAAALDLLTIGRPDDATTQLPVFPLAQARSLAELAATVHGGQPGDHLVDLADGSAALRPVISIAPPEEPLRATELPFPALRLHPTTLDLDPAGLGRTLSLAILGGTPDQTTAYLAANNIRNVFTNGTPTTNFTPGAPHDGSIIDHLTERKTSNHPPADGGSQPSRRRYLSDGEPMGRSDNRLR